MRNIKLVLEYDGSAFYGFQKQRGRPSVQEALEKAFSGLFNKKIKIAAASGRTDTGVHAESQVVNFRTDSKLRLEKIQGGLNAWLPKEIAVIGIEEVPSKFHARYSAKTKVYEYSIWNHPVRSPLRAHWTCHVPQKLDASKMQGAAKYLVGCRDFASFCASDPARNGKEKDKRNTVRTLHAFKIRRKGSLIQFEIKAGGFLYHMVRNMVGTLIEVGQGKITAKDFKRILEAKDRRKAGPTALAQGLILKAVNYQT